MPKLPTMSQILRNTSGYNERLTPAPTSWLSTHPSDAGGRSTVTPPRPPTASAAAAWPPAAAASTPEASPPAPPAPFDYNAALLNDPQFALTRDNLSAQGIANAAKRKAGVNQAIGQFGEVPDFANTLHGLGLDPSSPMYQMLVGDIDPETARSAKSLTDAGLSTTAGLSRTHQQAVGNLLDLMAARGTVQSGATGVGLNLEDQAYSGNQFKARQDLLSYLTGIQEAFASAQGGIQGQFASGAQDAVTRQLAQYQAANPAVAPTAPAPPDIKALLAALNIGGG